MRTTLPLSIAMAALPPNVAWTPQQLADAIAARLSIVTQQSLALFVSGSTEPATDVGPWWDGQSWHYYSYVTGNYQPIVLAPESLGYTIGANPPDPTIYSVWIETTAGGSPLAVKTYYGGAWVDVYAAQLVLKAPLASPALTGTPTAPTAAPGTNTTQIATTAFSAAAIAAAIAALPPATPFAAYPAQATNAAPQTIPIDAAAHKVTVDTADFNPAPAPFDLALSRYIAPADGVYSVSLNTQFDNNGGASAAMRVSIDVRVNGASVGYGTESNVPSPTGDRWFPGITVLLNLSQNDFIEFWATATDGVDAANIDLTTFDFGVHRVSA